MNGSRLALSILLLTAGCIAPSVVDEADRAPRLETASLDWSPATASDLPGTYVSTELEGSLAVVLRKVVYLFQADGAYSGAALVEGAPPHFEVSTGRWRLEAGTLRLDDGPPAAAEVAQDGSLRLTGPEGSLVLRREVAR